MKRQRRLAGSVRNQIWNIRDKTKVHWCQKTTYNKNAGQLQGVWECERVWKCVRVCVCAVVHVSRHRSDEMNCQPSPGPVSVSWMGPALRCLCLCRSWLHEWIAMAPAPHRSNYCNYYEIMQNAYAISRRDRNAAPALAPDTDRAPVWADTEAEAKAGAAVCCLPSAVCCLLSASASGTQSQPQCGVWVMGQLVWLGWEQVQARVALQVTRRSCMQGRSCSNWSLRDLSYRQKKWEIAKELWLCPRKRNTWDARDEMDSLYYLINIGL